MNNGKNLNLNNTIDKKFMKHPILFLIIVTVMMVFLVKNEKISPPDFIDYQEMDVNVELIDCQKMVEHEDRSGFAGRFSDDVIDYEWNSKYQFKQCRVEINALVQESCEKSIRSHILYNHDYNNGMVSDRTLSECSSMIKEKLDTIYLGSNLTSLFDEGALITIPYYMNMLNAHSISQVSVPYQKILKGVYTVKMTSIENVEYFAYFKSKKQALKFIKLISIKLNQGMVKKNLLKQVCYNN